MAVITISRQMGSMGCEIAHAVKDRLGYRIVWRELINEAAIKSGMPSMALAVIDELGLLGLSPTQKEHQAYWKTVHQVMHALAEEGNVVIVGRAGQAILRSQPGVLHVRLTAPLQMRAERVSQRQNIDLEPALAQVKASDKARANYLKRFYRVRWDDTDLYHLIINTGLTSAASATDLIYQAALNLTVEESDKPKQQET
jgi:CMP/dCMP kinase